MTFVADDCMVAVLGDTQIIGNVMFNYWSLCHDDVMNLGKGLQCGDGGGHLPDSPFHV